MERGLEIWRCTNCKAGYFPERFICPKCRSAAFAKERVYDGVIEEITTIRHVLGQQDVKAISVGSVRTDDGQVLLVGLREPFAVGSRVELFEDRHTPFAGKSATAAS